MGKFFKTQWFWQGVKLSQLISIFTSKNVWKSLIKIQLTKSNPKIIRGVNQPCSLLNFYNFDTKLNKLHFASYFCTVGPRIQIKGICNNPEKLKFKVNRGLGNELAHIISAVDESRIMLRVDLKLVQYILRDLRYWVPDSISGPQSSTLTWPRCVQFVSNFNIHQKCIFSPNFADCRPASKIV